jgi:arylsulfatase A-like enzyme
VDVRQGEQARAAVDFLRNRGKDGPFFLDVGFLETHRTEWIVHGFSLEHHSPRDGDGDPSYVQVPAPLPDHPDTRRDWLDLRHAVERLDGCYGEILRALHEAGLADDTLVIATTDHGPALPDMKCKLTHHGTGVLQILRFPGGRGRGRVVDALVSHLDFYPTVCELLGVPAPEWAEGKSLLPLVAETPAEAIREVIFSEVTFHAAFEPKRCVRDKKWNYIRNFAAPHPEVLPNCDDGHSKRFWMKRGLRERQVPEEELYDLTFDPQERCNRADDPDCAEIKSAMREKLRRWMEETDDLLLQSDPAVLPERLTVNPWDNDHPGKEGSVEWDRSEWSKIRPL